MKKSLLSLSAIMLCASSIYAQQPVAQWGSLMGGAQGDQSSAIVITSEGSALWLSTAASTEAAPEVYYNNEALFDGALYNAGNSGNNNLSLICTASDGSVKWVVYSNSGDYASGQGGVAVDNEGNFVFSAKVRHTDGMTDRQLNVVDSKGTVHELGGTCEKRFNRLLVAKGNAQGEILWTKLIDVSTAPAPAASGNNADFTSDAVSAAALTVDAEGNIYIGGNYASALTVDGVTIEPVNVSTWTGDSQTSCGNMYLIKLDADGNYVASAVGEGDIDGYSSLQCLQWHEGHLYLAGYARGTGDFSFCGSKLTPSDVTSLIIGRVDSALKADWMKCCAGATVEDKSALQNVGISLCADNLWVCGQFNQKIIDPTDPDLSVAATQGKLREGFIVKFDKNTGAWKADACSRDGFPEIAKLTGYFKAIQSADHLDKVYVYGYVMDANIGIFLREYSADDLSAVTDDAWSLATGGGVPTACAIAYDSKEGTAYITGRGNKAFTLMGDITTDAPKNWDVLMAKFTLPASLLSMIDGITVSDMPKTNDIYDLWGRRVASADAASSLAPGIYICNNKKFIVR